MAGYSGLSVEDLTNAEYQGRDRMMKLFEYARANFPGFEEAYMLGAAEQIGVRQTRLLRGEYVVTMDDLVNRRHSADSVCRGRDYYTPYRALLPTNIEQLIVAGRHYSVEPDAQRISPAKSLHAWRRAKLQESQRQLPSTGTALCARSITGKYRCK